MQKFLYESVDREGRGVVGTMVARDERNLEERLSDAGLWLVEARPEAEAVRTTGERRGLGRGGRTKRRELIDFCTLMSFQLRAGILLLTALDVVAADCLNAHFKAKLLDIRRQVESGEALSAAMEHFPRSFNAHFTSLVKAAEQSATLPEAFMELKRYLEWQEQILADVRQATIYPLIVLIVVCIFTITLFTLVIPKFALLLTAAKVPLPLITKVMFGLSAVAKATWWIWLPIVTVMPVAIQIARKHWKAFAIGFDRFRFRLPVMGELYHLLVMCRLAHNVAVLYRSGITVINALKLTRPVVGSALVATLIDDVWQRMETGEFMSEAMRRHALFPQLLVRMVVMGEKTGTLDTSLENVATYYNVVIPRAIKKVFSIAEPCLIVLLVCLVGSVALSVFLPILSLMDAIK